MNYYEELGKINKKINKLQRCKANCGSGANIYNSDGEIQANRTVDYDDKHIMFGNILFDNFLVTGIGHILGNLVSWSGLPITGGSVERWLIKRVDTIAQYRVWALGDGIFMGSHGADNNNPETEISATSIDGDVNVASLSAYPADGIDQMGRCAAQYTKSTGEGYGMICMASDYDIQSRNYFAAFNHSIKGRYYHSTTGDLFNILIDDDGFTVNNGTSNFVKVDYSGNVISPTIAALNFVDDTAAAAGGVPLNGFYHTAGVMKIRLV
jgi:hypothetical protein